MIAMSAIRPGNGRPRPSQPGWGGHGSGAGRTGGDGGDGGDAGGAALERVGILIVDDIPEKRLTMSVLLEDLGQDVIAVGSGREALRALLEREFAVILLDVNMPDMDGFETARRIRQRQTNECTPIIFVTAFGDEMHAIRGYSLGAVDYILSPVVPEILRMKVSVFVDLHRKTAQIRRQAEQKVELARAEAARAASETARRRSAFLAEATAILMRSLDYDTTLESFARVLVPELGEWAAVTMAGDGLLRPRTYVARAPRAIQGQAAGAPTVDGVDLPRTELAEPLQAVIARGTAADVELVIDDEPRRALLIPLAAHGRTLGAISLLGLPADERAHAERRALAEDLADRAAMAIDNARLYRDIREADRRKNEFLAMLAHELRNPLAPIRTAAELLRRSGHEPLTLGAARNVIDRQVTQMARLVDDLLDVSRITSGKVRLQLRTLEVAAVVHHALETTRPMIEGRRQNLAVKLPEVPGWVMGDLERLSQVLSNLLNNASKYTEEGGRIALEVGRVGGEIVIRVRDSGVGIPPEMLAIIFDLFIQVDRSLDRSQGGLGIGLTIVRRLVELHGGYVEASSEGVGRGSEFSVHLPEGHVPAREVEATKGGLMNTTEGQPARVLVVDDNIDAAEMIGQLLELSGHQVTVVHDGPAALAAAEEISPEYVLLDIGLPAMNGYEVARHLRGTPNTARAILIAVTGYGQESDRARAREAGFDHHLVKPVNPEALLKLVTRSAERVLGGPVASAGPVPVSRL